MFFLLFFEKLMLTRGDGLENWKLRIYFSENVLENIQ